MALTAKQIEANQEVFETSAEHIMLFGGSRSSKTYLICRNIALRAIKAPKSRHVILRFRFNSVKTSIGMDTMPKVLKNEFNDIRVELNKTDWMFRFPNGSEIWLSGLDTAERTEKILGHEYATIYFNECSQIAWQDIQMALTRLAQLVYQVVDGIENRLKARAYYDENPPSKAHWSYKLFIKKQNVDTGLPLSNPDNYLSKQLNPIDNINNLSPEYMQSLEALSARLRRRFMDGLFAEATPNQLFNEDDIERWRVIDGIIPDMIRVVVSVDPSGSGDIDNADNDAIGIIVAGIGTDGNGYILEDCTLKASPAIWGNVATTAYDRHMANVIVGESNFGGDMVRYTIQTTRPNTPYKAVTASRGKHVRAEPFSALYEQGKIRHVGRFHELEDELSQFSTSGWLGNGSPNRADALIWALAELFPGFVKPKQEYKKPNIQIPVGWM